MLEGLRQIRAAFSLLNPDEVQKLADREVSFGLVAEGPSGYRELEDFLVPAGTPPETRARILRTVHRAGDPAPPPHVDIILYEQGLPCPHSAFTYFRDDPQATVAAILAAEQALALPLARRYPAFRKTVVDRVVQAVSRENALFALATALPNIVPTLFELPWSVSEFASDTVFLTANQVRMAFLISAACGGEIGFAHQKAELFSIGAGAFGWRALARELAGKIPLGGGLIPKGAIAYAATYVIGKGLEHYHHANAAYTPAEREEIYQQAYEQGKTVAQSVSRQAG